ncbi:hypothetical protein COV18_07490 [Candidatus Woesearchaeota archaeon CG10_big_fil_rev_8_21_14_0_10_37_12]|nr:MAG: hypothetical protein COV18_07490 [Candidatus Woesearchaeota archaeon CG10_big_fil_rev_8_21_14_0_10_37_12]
MLNQEKIDVLFQTLRKVHKCHWKAPKLDDVQKEIHRIGVFVFRIGNNPWVAEVRITENGVEYVVNQDLSERMRKDAEKMKEEFEKLIQ